tara:strand:+ start:245 stop:496 length:252 start_codon:yes stop_codon:yes gene_type:complete
MEITNEMVIFVLVFMVGLVCGIYIMTQVNTKQERKTMSSLLELEDNLIQFKNEVNELRVDKRLAEARLTIANAKLNELKIIEV